MKQQAHTAKTDSRNLMKSLNTYIKLTTLGLIIGLSPTAQAADTLNFSGLDQASASFMSLLTGPGGKLAALISLTLGVVMSVMRFNPMPFLGSLGVAAVCIYGPQFITGLFG